MGEVIGKSDMKELVTVWGGQSEKGSWFQRQGEASQMEQSIIFRENDEGARARVTTDEERVLQERWTDMVMKVLRLGICENFLGKWE